MDLSWDLEPQMKEPRLRISTIRRVCVRVVLGVLPGVVLSGFVLGVGTSNERTKA